MFFQGMPSSQMNPGIQVTCIIVLNTVVPGGEPDLNNRPEVVIFAPGSPQLIALQIIQKFHF